MKITKTKIFCDIAELKQIKKFNKKKIVKGFTTNPSLMKSAGAKNYKDYSKKILRICPNKPVSLEVFADDYENIKDQALKINTWGKNVYVKIPVTNTKGVFMGKIIKELNNMNIKLNITAVYNFKQTEKILKLINKKSKVIISIFAGRAGDTGKDPLPEFKKSIYLAKKFKNVEILWASVREPYNYTQAKQLGCHIITIPPSTIEKIEKFGKSFDQLTQETVKAFYKDAKTASFKIQLKYKKNFSLNKTDTLSSVAPFRIVNIGNSKKIKLLDFIKSIEANLGKKALRNYMPMQKGDVFMTLANTKLLKKLTGTIPKTNYKEGVRKFIKWYLDYYGKQNF